MTSMLMKKFSFYSLRVRLIVLISLAVLPELGLTFYTALQQKRFAAMAAQEEALRIARLVSATQGQLIEAARQLLIALAKVPEVRRQDPQRCGRVFSSILADHPFYANFGAIKPNGELFCSALPYDQAVNLADRSYFRTAVQTKEFAVGDYQIGRVTKKASINFGYPLLGERGDVEAVVFAALDLRWFNRLATEVNLAEGARVVVVDHKGTILARIPDPDLWVGKSAYEASIVNTVVRAKEGTTEAIGLDGVERLFAFTPVANIADRDRVFVWVGIPKQAAFAEVNRIFSRNLTAIAVVTLLALIAAWIGSDWFVLRRVNALVSATERVAEGNLHTRSGLPHGKDEVGQLSQSFDKMAAALERRYDELQTLREIDQSILSTLDLKVILDNFLDKVDSHLPYAAASIELFDQESKRLVPLASRHVEAAQKDEAKQAMSFLSERVFKNRNFVAIGDLEVEVEVNYREMLATLGFASYAGVPLNAGDSVLGVLSVYTKSRRHFTKEEIDFLATLAGQAAIAIQNSQLYERTKKQAVELERASKVKDEFLSVMSHELRTPLNVIMGYTSLLQDRLFGEVKPEQETALKKITTHAQDLLELVSGILQATQIEAREISCRVEKIAVNQFMEEIHGSYAYRIGNEITMVWEIPSALPVLETDPEKLKIVLRNLINNAIKFTRSGQVAVSVRYVPGENKFIFGVRDTGVGIAKENSQVIFEMFRQVDSSETRTYGGVGMGLYIVKKYSFLLGGTIEFDSELGKGSDFRMILPAVWTPTDENSR